MSKYKSYDEFWLERLSYEAQPASFTKEEVEWAIRQTEHKYFGEYQLCDNELIAVDILVHVAKECINE